MIIKHVLEALLNPLCIVLFLMFLAILLPSRSLWVIAFFLLLLISCGWLPQLATEHLEQHYPRITQIDKQIHWIVVLSGGEANNSELPAETVLHAASIKRLLEGIRLLRQNPDARLLLSGGGYLNETPEAVRMQELSSWFAIPTERIVLETRSKDTAEQVQEIKSILQDEPFYLVTSAVHMPRAMALSREVGLKPIAAPSDYTLYWQDEKWQKRYIPNPHNMVYLSIAWHEYLGMAWMKLKRIIPL